MPYSSDLAIRRGIVLETAGFAILHKPAGWKVDTEGCDTLRIHASQGFRVGGLNCQDFVCSRVFGLLDIVRYEEQR